MALEDAVAAVRDFSRVLRRCMARQDPWVQDADMGPLEFQVFEALGAAPDGLSGPQLSERMRLDKAQLSRYVESFRKRRYISTEAAPWDRRIRIHRLTPKGTAAFRGLGEQANEGLVHVARRLPAGDRARLVDAITTVRQIVEGQGSSVLALAFREARAGDFGWVIERHGTLYHAEYGYDESFEAFVAHGVAEFILHRDPARECAFIAERGGARAGSAFVVKASARVARLRFVFVEPTARGHGVGGYLLDQCLAFARSARYDRIVLTTHSILKPAHALYRSRGFRMEKEASHAGFGFPVRAQDWVFDLRARARSTARSTRASA